MLMIFEHGICARHVIFFFLLSCHARGYSLKVNIFVKKKGLDINTEIVGQRDLDAIPRHTLPGFIHANRGNANANGFCDLKLRSVTSELGEPLSYNLRVRISSPPCQIHFK